MKNLKLSFAVVVALLAVGITFATKAGNRAVTRCFTVITVDDASALPQQLLDESLTCTQANTLKTNGFIHIISASLANSLGSQQECPVSTDIFCCAKVVEVPTDPIAQPVDLGEGLRKYQITDIYCKAE